MSGTYDKIRTDVRNCKYQFLDDLVHVSISMVYEQNRPLHVDCLSESDPFPNPDLSIKIPCWSRGSTSICGPSEVPADCEFRKEDLVLACTPASLYHDVSSPGSRLWVLVSGIVLDEQAYGSGNETIIFCLMWSSLCDSMEMMSSCTEENPSKPELPKS